MPTSTTSTIFSSSTVQKLQALGTGAKAAGQNVLALYFSQLPWLEVLSVIISALLIYAIIRIIVKTGWVNMHVSRIRHVILKSDIARDKVRKEWNVIQEHFYRGDENDLRVAIIEADKLLNEALREAGVLGLHLGDRLKKANADQIPNIDDLWQAHKIRNQIAHETSFRLKRDLAERALTIYETALKNLGVFDEETESPSGAKSKIPRV